MGSDKKEKKKEPKTGWYRFGSGLLWAGGQFAVTWFLNYDWHLWQTISAIFSAFVAGWATAALLGRVARFGAGPKIMMVSGLIFGVAIFSGAFTGLEKMFDWWKTKSITMDWEKLQSYLLSWSVVPPAVLGIFSGLYVRAKIPLKSSKG